MYSKQPDPLTQRATQAFLAKVRALFEITQAFLYGSRARGDATAYSDADVALVLHSESAQTSQQLFAAPMQLSDMAYDVLLGTGIRISPLPIWEDEWLHPQTYSNPRLLQNIAREGIRL